MSKYVVKNCPAIRHNDEFELDNHCDANNVDCFFCENISDCLIKRVIEEVKWEIKTIPNENDRGDLAERILDMFEIQEVEE